MPDSGLATCVVACVVAHEVPSSTHERSFTLRCDPVTVIIPRVALQVLDLGSNIGSFTLYALERGCHVISFDMLLENVLSVLQTLNRAVAADGRLYLERWHGFWNGVR